MPPQTEMEEPPPASEPLPLPPAYALVGAPRLMPLKPEEKASSLAAMRGADAPVERGVPRRPRRGDMERGVAERVGRDDARRDRAVGLVAALGRLLLAERRATSRTGPQIPSSLTKKSCRN